MPWYVKAQRQAKNHLISAVVGMCWCQFWSAASSIHQETSEETSWSLKKHSDFLSSIPRQSWSHTIWIWLVWSDPKNYSPYPLMALTRWLCSVPVLGCSCSWCFFVPFPSVSGLCTREIKSIDQLCFVGLNSCSQGGSNLERVELEQSGRKWTDPIQQYTTWMS